MSLPSSDERSCDHHANKNYNQEGAHQADFEDFEVSEAVYQSAFQDATDAKYESSVPIIRKAARSWQDAEVYVDLCALLINYGHTRGTNEAITLYNEAETNCNNALALNPHISNANENLEAIRSSRKIRGIFQPKIRAGRFRVKKKRNAEVKTENVKKSGNKESAVGSYNTPSSLADSLKIHPGPIDDGNLQFRMYNGSSVNPGKVILRLGEVYVEDDFISREERLGLIEIVEKGLPWQESTGEKGPLGAVIAVPMSDIGPQLSKEQRNLVARIRERVVNRANDLKGLDTPVYNIFRGVRAHTTSFIRYIGSGKHNIHHDNDFVNRCLSSSIVLNDGFQGGEFNLHTTKNERKLNLEGFPIIGTVKGKAGRLSLFLSQTVHSVNEVVSGTRDVFFLWYTCDVDAEYQLDDPLEHVDDRKPWVATA